MGTLRTLFAIAVVFAHCYGFLLVGGRNAVQLFYMISGFLISFVLIEQRAYLSMKSFYINRFLRLYPVYFVVALMTLATLMFGFWMGKDVDFFNIYREAPIAANSLLIFANIVLFCQDWLMFVGVESHQLVFSTDFSKSEIVLFPALLVPQAWTLGVELSFYLIAPFILREKRTMLMLLALSLCVRVYLLYIGLGEHDPWTYRFFPTELAFFLLGALSHQYISPLYRKFLAFGQMQKYASISTYALIFFTLLYSFIPVIDIVKTIGFFILFLILMPLCFVFQSNKEWDKKIGNLSYPIYIGHLLVIYIINFIFGEITPDHKILILGKLVPIDRVIFAVSVVTISVGFAIFLDKTIATPVESIRRRFKKIG